MDREKYKQSTHEREKDVLGSPEPVSRKIIKKSREATQN